MNGRFCKNCGGELGMKYQEAINKKTGSSFHYYHLRKSFAQSCKNPEIKIECKNCGEAICLGKEKKWIHFHRPHNVLIGECKVCACPKAEPKLDSDSNE